MNPEQVESGDDFAMVIPEDANFTEEEIEELREADASYKWGHENHIVANFMPDETRPAWVPRL